MGVILDALPEKEREKLKEELSDPEPENCDHRRSQYVTDGQRWCEDCDSEIERDGEGGFRLFTDGEHDEAYN